MADLFDIMYESQSNSTKQDETTKPVEIIKQTENIVIQDEVVVTQQEDVERLETADVTSQQETIEILNTETSNTFPALEVEIQPKTVVPSPAPKISYHIISCCSTYHS